MIWLQKHTPGIVIVTILALFAAWLGSLFPLVGGPVFGILIGILLNNTAGKPLYTVKGVLFCSKKVLQWAIIALGGGLSLSQVWQTGRESFVVMILSLSAALIAAYVFGRLLRIPGRMQTLIGVGTSICGGSAIAAVSPIIEADEADIAYSVSTIFLFNLAAVILFPWLGHAFGLSDQAFGLWAGTAINDTSSVVAAGYIYSSAAGDYATIVKLSRATMIIPIAFLFALLVGLRKKRESADSNVQFRLSSIFPWFILWFLVASLLNSFGLFSQGMIHFASGAAKFMIIMALTAIGLSADFRKMIKSGVRPIILGMIVWFVVASVSLFVQSLTGQL